MNKTAMNVLMPVFWRISAGMCSGIEFLGPRMCIYAQPSVQSCQFSEVIVPVHTPPATAAYETSSCPTSSLALGFFQSFKILATLVVYASL